MTKPANCRNFTVWLSPDTVAAIDERVARIAREPGARTSRNAWIVDAIQAALAPPALQAHRGRLAEAAALEAEEGQP